MESFEELEAWQEARRLSSRIYSLTSRLPFSNDYSLKDQIRRASNSICLNIAEGFARRSDRDFMKFLDYARGSAAEVQSALYLARDQQYLSEDDCEALHEQAERVSQLITGLIEYLNEA